MNSNLSQETSRTPRTDSLHHRLLHLKDANGERSPLVDELLFLLDDPPSGTDDRWEKGAELCREHGIETSRMAVWRFYRTAILQWRREMDPPAPEPLPTHEEIARLEQQVRYLAAQRALDLLRDPRLNPVQLIQIMRQNERYQKTDLAHAQFKDELHLRKMKEHREKIQRLDDEVRERALAGMNLDPMQKMVVAGLIKPTHTT